MPASRTKLTKNKLKRQGDPLGTLSPLRCPKTKQIFIFYFLDDILKTNLYLSNYARPASDNHPLGRGR